MNVSNHLETGCLSSHIAITSPSPFSCLTPISSSSSSSLTNAYWHVLIAIDSLEGNTCLSQWDIDSRKRRELWVSCCFHLRQARPFPQVSTWCASNEHWSVSPLSSGPQGFGRTILNSNLSLSSASGQWEYSTAGISMPGRTMNESSLHTTHTHTWWNSICRHWATQRPNWLNVVSYKINNFRELLGVSRFVSICSSLKNELNTRHKVRHTEDGS